MTPLSACSDLRHRLNHSRTECEPNVPPEKRFFSESSIRQLLTRDRVKALLECNCSTCDQYRGLQQIIDPASYVSSVLPTRSKDLHGDSGYVLLLALLIHIECPGAIYTFIRRRCGDGQLKNQTARFTHEYVRDTFLRTLPLDYAQGYAEKFHWEKYKFAIPRMEGEQHEEYPAFTILPFVNEKRVGRMGVNGEIVSEGHFGDVYSFDILEEYCHFPVSFWRPSIVPGANLIFLS